MDELSTYVNLDFKIDKVLDAVYSSREFGICLFESESQIERCVIVIGGDIPFLMSYIQLKFYTTTNSAYSNPPNLRHESWMPSYNGTVYRPVDVKFTSGYGTYICTNMWVSPTEIICEWSLDESAVYYGTYFDTGQGTNKWRIHGNAPNRDSNFVFLVSSNGLPKKDHDIPPGTADMEIPISGAVNYFFSYYDDNGSIDYSESFPPWRVWPDSRTTDLVSTSKDFPYSIQKVIQTGNNIPGASLDGDLKMCAIVRQGSSSIQNTNNFVYPLYAHNMNSIFKQMNLILKEREATYVKFEIEINGQPFAQMGYKTNCFLGRTTQFRLIRAALTNKIILKNFAKVENLLGLQALPTEGFSSWITSSARSKYFLSKLNPNKSLKPVIRKANFRHDFEQNKLVIVRQASMVAAGAMGAGRGFFDALVAQWQWQQQADWSKEMQKERLAMMEKIAAMNNQSKLDSIRQSGAQERINQNNLYNNTMNSLGAGAVSAQNGMYTPSNYSTLPSYKTNNYSNYNFYNNSNYSNATTNNTTNNTNTVNAPTINAITNNSLNPNISSRPRMPTPSEAYDKANGFTPTPGPSKSIAMENINPNLYDEQHDYEVINPTDNQYDEINYEHQNISRENKNSSKFGNVGILDHKYAELDFSKNNTVKPSTEINNEIYQPLSVSTNNYEKPSPNKLVDNENYQPAEMMIKNSNYEPASLERKNSLYNSNLKFKNGNRYSYVPGFRGPSQPYRVSAKPASFSSGTLSPPINQFQNFSKPT